MAEALKGIAATLSAVVAVNKQEIMLAPERYYWYVYMYIQCSPQDVKVA